MSGWFHSRARTRPQAPLHRGWHPAPQYICAGPWSSSTVLKTRVCSSVIWTPVKGDSSNTDPNPGTRDSKQAWARENHSSSHTAPWPKRCYLRSTCKILPDNAVDDDKKVCPQRTLNLVTAPPTPGQAPSGCSVNSSWKWRCQSPPAGWHSADVR